MLQKAPGGVLALLEGFYVREAGRLVFSLAAALPDRPSERPAHKA